MMVPQNSSCSDVAILDLELLLFLSADYRSSIGGRENTKKALYYSFLSFSPSLSALFVCVASSFDEDTILFLKVRNECDDFL
jgi:hypothetical protein